MLTNQLIGAAHNAVNHAPRAVEPANFGPQIVGPTPGTKPAEDAITTKAVEPADENKGAKEAEEKRAPLETPKRVEMQVAVVDSIPDAVPETIYEAKAVREAE